MNPQAGISHSVLPYFCFAVVVSRDMPLKKYSFSLETPPIAFSEARVLRVTCLLNEFFCTNGLLVNSSPVREVLLTDSHEYIWTKLFSGGDHWPYKVVFFSNQARSRWKVQNALTFSHSLMLAVDEIFCITALRLPMTLRRPRVMNMSDMIHLRLPLW